MEDYLFFYAESMMIIDTSSTSNQHWDSSNYFKIL